MSAICPFCGFEVIPGDDFCGECKQSLSDFDTVEPATAVERALVSDRVGQLGPKSPIVVAADTPVGEALNTLVERKIGCLLVEQAGQVTGIFSERDALLKLGADVNELRGRPVSEFMTSNPETLPHLAKVAFAVQRMDLGGYRHLPIVGADGTPDGVISVRDILRYLTNQM